MLQNRRDTIKNKPTTIKQMNKQIKNPKQNKTTNQLNKNKKQIFNLKFRLQHLIARFYQVFVIKKLSLVASSQMLQEVHNLVFLISTVLQTCFCRYLTLLAREFWVCQSLNFSHIFKMGKTVFLLVTNSSHAYCNSDLDRENPGFSQVHGEFPSNYP